MATPLAIVPARSAVLSMDYQTALISIYTKDDEELLERAWDEHVDPFTHTVATTMSRLRAKLGEPTVIETVPQAGYRIG